jgi:hypothetical protein
VNPRQKKKRAKPFAANNASIKKLEAEGWTCAVVEHRIPHCFITKDLFGFADILAISPSRGMLAVQATGGGNGPARVAKIKAEPRAAIWLACGGRIQVHDWRKRAGVKERECCVFEPSAVATDQDPAQSTMKADEWFKLVRGGAPAICLWKHDAWHDYYDTQCGNALCLETGTPQANKYTHCPCCGGKIIYDNPPASTCCSAPIIVAGGKEGTNWHECTACGEACDPA